MNHTTIKLLGFAPILYAGCGAWVYSNQQTFFNKVEPNTDQNIFMPAGHAFDDFWTELNPGSVFFVYLMILVCLWVVKMAL